MRKVTVIGTTGSGKTTVSRLLAQRLCVRHVELDALFWKPGWVMPSAEEFRPIVEAALEPNGWVVDGNYRTRLGTFVLEKADVVVWLDLPLRTKFSRIFRRTLRRVSWAGSAVGEERRHVARRLPESRLALRVASQDASREQAHSP